MISKRYNLINNVGGWFVFAIALLTYWLTLEPTASYWDCGEFIIQADKLEVGHPPGNPIFMLTARFFANFASSVETISVMVNAMSGLLSALTILLLFWTITHLVRRLVVKDGQKAEISWQKYVVIMGSGLVGALAYCWSDTFWFSAVEGEVYAFSSFCTALVFWLILKWENRADEPHSDRYLILIAYIIGVSVAVHLLNLLCIPAIVLVFAYKKKPNLNLVGSLVALLISFAIIFFVLYGLVPGFIKVAQVSELLFVNGFHLGFNSGAIAYIILMIAALLWALYELRRQKSSNLIKLSFTVAVTLSGILFIGSGIWWGILLTIGLIILFWYGFKTSLPIRVLNVIMWSIAVIFVGYSSYALIIIRSTADTPMNQNSPDNVFDLASYLNREQYGETPLLYGQTLYSGVQRLTDGSLRYEKGPAIYAKGVKGATPVSENNFLSQGDINKNADLERRGGDYYVKKDYKGDVVMNPELNMVFPRLYSSQHAASYENWVKLDTMPDQLKAISYYDKGSGRSEPSGEVKFKPSFSQNLAYFFNYQLNHMYMRYFLWNFVGRQNDVLNQRGELDAGNWISGLSFVDNPRLGDQSLMVDALGKDNPAHNTFYFLPLILGIIGLIWQSFAGRRGIEQFWVVFFLFFMTGIAIVLYLNQTPDQPRERDYAFAGSFYAFAIWIGIGVAGLWQLFMLFMRRRMTTQENSEDTKIVPNQGRSGKNVNNDQEPDQSVAMTEEPISLSKKSLICSAIALVLGLVIPIQMVSQTWDDHDRSGRYAARDFAINYLESLEPNAIVFCNGDNDTFPLWYAQEVEGIRPDVKIINLSYLNSDWYANQHRMPSYKAAPAPMTAKQSDIAYGRRDIAILPQDKSAPADLLQSLRALYAAQGVDPRYGYPVLASSVVTIPIDKKLMVEKGLVAPADTAEIVDRIEIDLPKTESGRKGYITLGEILMLDIIATNAAQGWPRPIYWASTVGDSYHVGLTPYMRSTGMTYQLVPTRSEGKLIRSDRAYDVITKKYQWGTRENGKQNPYFDETARRMLYGVRSSMVDLASMLYAEGQIAGEDGKKQEEAECYKKGLQVLNLLEQKVPERVSPYDFSIAVRLGSTYCSLGEAMNDKSASKRGLQILEAVLIRNAKGLQYYNDVNRRFVNPALTYESQYIPYQYYQVVEMYEKYGGDVTKVDKILKDVGLSLSVIQKWYQGVSEAAEAGGSSNMQDLATEVLSLCEISNRMAALSPEEYAKQSAEDRQCDSIVEMAIEYYLMAGGDEELLKKSDAYNKLDRKRTKRLSEESQKNNTPQ